VGIGSFVIPSSLREVTAPAAPPRETNLSEALRQRTALDAITTASVPKPQPLSEEPLAYAPAPKAVALRSGLSLLSDPAPAPADTKGVAEAISAYRAGDLARGDAAAATANNKIARVAAEWAALRLLPREAGFERIATFLKDNPDWPLAAGLKRRAEELLHIDKRPAPEVLAWFRQNPPASALGKLVYARALLAQGDQRTAHALVREVWREADLSPAQETNVLKDFPGALGKADHKLRADVFFYKDNAATALRAATLAGPDILALQRARSHVTPTAIEALAPEWRKDVSLIYAQAKKLRRENKFTEAAHLLNSAPIDATRLVNGDEWWVERRIIARKLLDLGETALAYKLCAEHSAQANDQRIEAEFHAGWIALRFLNDPNLAARHFASGSMQAKTPISIARMAYWSGRTFEAQNKPAQARAQYEIAAELPITYYGQLAMARLDRHTLTLRMPVKRAQGDDRALAIRVIDVLAALDQKDLASPIAIEAARNFTDEAQIAALAAATWRMGDARATLNVGKFANQRGFMIDEAAFPTFGIPQFEALPGSASPALVYSIARQESAFDSKAQSSAGAKGLMQMLASTAKRTAQRAGVAFDEQRLLSDASFNAKLGAAHLGELMVEHPGPLILTFAAYNAGGRRVREWIAAYGDPRDPKTDAVDWVERIPFTETRNYVQRVTENLEVYRHRFGETNRLQIDATLRGLNR
jgi:soluble lytic murein transglycosylase